MKNLERNSFIFYRSFYEVCQDFEDPDIQDEVERKKEMERLELIWFRAITKYALSGVEPLFSDRILRMAWRNVFPVIFKSNQNYKNGVLGGRPKKEEKTESEPKHNQSKTETKPKQNQSKTEAKADISSSSNNNTKKELEPEPNLEPNPNLEPELKLEPEVGLVSSAENLTNQEKLERFQKEFPKIVIDSKFQTTHNYDLLSKAIKESTTFLNDNRKKISLSLILNNYDKVIAGEWKDFETFKKEYFNKPFRGRTYTAEKLNSLFDNIDDIEV